MSDAIRVLIVILVIWLGIFLYLLRLEAAVRRLGRERDDR